MTAENRSSLSVSDFIQKMISYYPSLYKHPDPEISKQKVLGVLCGLGSGSEWDDTGNLALYFPDFDSYLLQKEQTKNRDLKRIINDYIQGVDNNKGHNKKSMEFNVLKARVKALDIPEETDEYILWSSIHKNYSPILMIPENIQPDWLDACIYVKKKLIEFYTVGIDAYISTLQAQPESLHRKLLLKEYQNSATLKQEQLKLCAHIKC